MSQPSAAIRPFRLSSGQLTSVALGRPVDGVLEIMRTSQRSKHLALLGRVLAAAGDDPLAARIVTTLDAARRRDPAGVDALIAEPWLGVWAFRRLREPATSLPLRGLGPAAATAAVAAARAGLDVDLPADMADGAVYLPGFGVARGPDSGTVMVHVRRGEIVVAAAGGWASVEPAHRLRVGLPGAVLAVAIADSGPFRDCYHLPLSAPLDIAALRRWQTLWNGAGSLLAQHAPERAAETAALLRAVVPLADGGKGVSRSATSHSAFGAFALTLPESAARLAVTIVHEVQHNKLNALLDLITLYRISEDGGHRYYAPWKDDLRPIGGLLHGVFAFTAVLDFWARLSADPQLHDMAAWEFADLCAQLLRAMPGLESSPELTKAGHRFVAGLRTNLERLSSLPPHRRAW